MNCTPYPLTYNEYYSLKRVNTYLKPCKTPNWLISCPPPIPEESACCPSICQHNPSCITGCPSICQHNPSCITGCPTICQHNPSCITGCHSETHCIDIMAVNNQFV